MPSPTHRNDPLALHFVTGDGDTTFVLPADTQLFAGHFDGYPIAPGALMLDWMFRKARAAGVRRPETAMHRSRFLREIFPGDSITVRCRPARRGLLVEVVCRNEVTAKAWFEHPA